MLHGIASAIPVLPKHYWINHDISKPSMNIPLMSGPYKILKAEVGRFIIMERVEDYWGSKYADKDGSLNYIGIKSPVIDTLIENLDFAKNRAEKVASVRALDRALVWGFYSIPLHYSPDIPVAYWNRFGRPEITPKWTRYLFTLIPWSWWIDKEMDAVLKKEGGFKP